MLSVWFGRKHKANIITMATSIFIAFSRLDKRRSVATNGTQGNNFINDYVYTFISYMSRVYKHINFWMQLTTEQN